jgi:hypothetical protein
MPTRSVDGFLGCQDCQLIAPVVAWSNAAPEDEEAYREFVVSHATHRTIRLSPTDTWSDRPLWDPMATVTFEVTDGTQTCVVHGSRQSVDEPRIYRFRPGALSLTVVAVDVEDGDVRRGLDRQFYPYALRPTKLDRFIATVQALVGRIAPEGIEIAFDVADDPTLSIAPMPEDVCQELSSRCAEIFDPWELPRVHEFLRGNLSGDGVLALRIRRNCRVVCS